MKKRAAWICCIGSLAAGLLLQGAAQAAANDAGHARLQQPESEQLLRVREQAVVMARRDGPRHPLVALALRELGVLQQRLCLEQQAAESYRRSLQLFEAALDIQDPEVTATLITLAAFYQDRGEHRAALRLLERALAHMDAAHPQFDTLSERLAFAQGALGRHREALQSYQRSAMVREILRRNLSEPRTLQVLQSMAGFELAAGDRQAAQVLYRRSLVLAAALFGPDHLETISLHSRAARAGGQGA